MLANARVFEAIKTIIDQLRRWRVLAGVIMPDHAHLFVSGGKDFLLTQWIRLLKRNLSKAISHPQPHWQKGFFDHLIRRGESYAEKWEYVRQNPVRAGLVSNCDDWLWQGEIIRIDQQDADY